MKKKLIKYAGSVVAVLTSAYLVYVLSKIDFSLLFERISPLWIIDALFLIFLYLFINIIRAVNWTYIVEFLCGYGSLDIRLVRIYLRTEAAKYLPSNLVHLAGRHLMARRLGYADSLLALSNMLDMGLLLVSAFLITFISVMAGVIALPDQLNNALHSKRFYAILCVGFFILLVLFIMLIRRRIVDLRRYITCASAMRLVRIVLLYVPGFVISAGMMAFALNVMLGITFRFSDLPFIFSAFTLAWITGFLVPGAPGGIGVREGMILVLFSPKFGADFTAVAALITRLVSISGDVAAWGASYFKEKKNQN